MTSSSDRIELHTINGRRRQSLPKKQYDDLSNFILQTLKKKNHVTLTELMELANKEFYHPFSGDVSWPLLSVKQDLQARGLIEISFEKKRVQMISSKNTTKNNLDIPNNMSANRDLFLNDQYVERRRVWMTN